MTEPTVESTMTTEVHSVRPFTPVAAILDLLTRHRISAVPVLDDAGRPLGVVSEGDILAAAARPGPAPTAANLMNRPVITIHPTESRSAAARRLSKEGIRRLFVVDQHGKLVGVVARRDLLAD